MNINLHPFMASWLLNELTNGSFTTETQEEEAILQQTLSDLADGPDVEWRVVPDDQVFAIWIDSDGERTSVPPSFYAEAGGPIDAETGEDMTYSHTEIALPKPPTIPEGALTVEVGRDATGYFTRTFTGTTLDELKDRMGKYGLRDDDLTSLTEGWDEASFSAFDDVEVYRVYDHTGELIFEYDR